MYKKRKTVLENAINYNLNRLCDELLWFNEKGVFAISRKFKETPSKALGEEIKVFPVIVSSIPIEELVIPTSLNLDINDNLTTWCDSNVLAKLVYSPIKFVDGNIKNKKIENLYLKFDNEDLINKSKQY